MLQLIMIGQENSKIDICEEEAKKLLIELRRRVNITYRIRIRATDRLKRLNEESQRVNVYYSALVTGGSVLTLAIDTWDKASSILLIASITLTYYMFYIAQNNYKERAYRMEESFKALDKLKNMIDIRLKAKDEKITYKDCKNLYKLYEQIIADIENHEPIDYVVFKMDEFNKKDKMQLTEIEKEELQRVKKQLKNYSWKIKWNYIFKYGIIPLAILGICVITINFTR